MNDEIDNKFNYGETVRIKDVVPSIFRPGEVVSICGMTKTDSKVLADKYGSRIGEWIYTIEYLRGSDIEIPESYLEEYQE